MLLLFCYVGLLILYRRRITELLNSVYKNTPIAIKFLAIVNHICLACGIAFLIFLFEGYGCYIWDLAFSIAIMLGHWFLWYGILI